MFKVINEFRVKKGPMASTENEGNNGFFVIPHYKIDNYQFYVQASDGMGWEHVSVSVAKKGERQSRCPTWSEMCWIKERFWDEEDCVIQYHPAKSEYVNLHPFVLHLWRPIAGVIPIPNKIMVG